MIAGKSQKAISYQYDRNDPHSCCRLDLAISEFGCQGLELDLPIVCWGPDLIWEDVKWEPRIGRARVVKDPKRLRFNAYRVLLTRGRDGVLIYVPRLDTLDQTYSALLRSGAQEL